MPTGVYDRKKAAARGSKKKLSQYPGPSENLQRLIDMQRELQERIDAERHREIAVAKLLRYARDAGLTPKDLRDAAKTLADRNVGDEPVVSKHADKASRASAKHHRHKPAVGTIGKAVRKAREALGLSSAQLADRLHMAHSIVPMIERGKRKVFTESLAKRLAEVLSLPVETFPVGDRKTPFPKVPTRSSSLNGAAAHD